jgi:hypothetical protein
VLICSEKKVLLTGCWLVVRENYCWPEADKPSELAETVTPLVTPGAQEQEAIGGDSIHEWPVEETDKMTQHMNPVHSWPGGIRSCEDIFPLEV